MIFVSTGKILVRVWCGSHSLSTYPPLLLPREGYAIKPPAFGPAQFNVHPAGFDLGTALLSLLCTCEEYFYDPDPDRDHDHDRDPDRDPDRDHDRDRDRDPDHDQS